MQLIGRVSFYGLHVVVSFDPARSETKLKYLTYGATTEKPKHLLKNIFGSNLTETPRQFFFLELPLFGFFEICLITFHKK